MDNILTVPIHLKMTLTAREAAEYSNIGMGNGDADAAEHYFKRF